MRSPDVPQLGMFSYVSTKSAGVGGASAIRRLPVLADTILAHLDKTLTGRYTEGGRPSIPPERLLMEQIDSNLPFRRFVGLNVDAPVWEHSTFSFDRCRTATAPCQLAQIG